MEEQNAGEQGYTGIFSDAVLMSRQKRRFMRYA